MAEPPGVRDGDGEDTEVSSLGGLFYPSTIVVAIGTALIWGVNGSVLEIDVNTIGGVVVLLGLIGTLLSVASWAWRQGSSIAPTDDENPAFRR
jgi:hypothetical protein